MLWNWQLPDWPHFKFDTQGIAPQERQFLLQIGSGSAFLTQVQREDYNQFLVEILTSEGIESSKIEGEILDRQSLQSSIKRHFGLYTHTHQASDKEAHMAALLCHVYDTFQQPLSHAMLWEWHASLFDKFTSIEVGHYRTHQEPMQIVSHRYDDPKIFFEAPPSAQIYAEMDQFIIWFNSSKPFECILARAAVTHVYFESIHPFEDGNGRIGRALVEKFLSQALGRPILIAISKVFERRKKEYYAALERCNRSLEIDAWLIFFADVVLEAQNDSMILLKFLIEKSKMITRLTGQLNPRQEKVLLRMFAEGPSGFKGGLSADNYIAITKTSRATATRDLSDLVQKEALTKTGELRHTRYWLHLPKELKNL